MCKFVHFQIPRSPRGVKLHFSKIQFTGFKKTPSKSPFLAGGEKSRKITKFREILANFDKISRKFLSNFCKILENLENLSKIFSPEGNFPRFSWSRFTAIKLRAKKSCFFRFVKRGKIREISGNFGKFRGNFGKISGRNFRGIFPREKISGKFSWDFAHFCCPN